MSVATAAVGAVAVPPGEPDIVRDAARRLRQVAADVRGGHGTLVRGFEQALGEWSSEASRAFATVSTVISRVYATIAHIHDAAADTLARFADVLHQAQQDALRAAAFLADAQAQFDARINAADSSLRAAAASTAANASSQSSQAQRDAASAHSEFEQAQRTAIAAGRNACDDVDRAAAGAAAALDDLAATMSHMTRHDVVDVIGAPNTLAELQTVGLMTASTSKALATFSALRGANFAELERLSANGFSAVEKIAAEFGPESMQTLRAWYGWMGNAGPDALREIGHAADGMGVAPEGLAGIFDTIGKFALPIAAVGDILTIADSKSSGLDRGLSGANLVGMAAAGAGTAVGETALGLVGLNAAADWIPVAGEVVMAGTALYLAGEWAYTHREEIANAARATGRAIGDAATWVSDEELKLARAGAQVAGQVVAGVSDAATATYHAAQAVADTVVSGAQDAAANVVRGAGAVGDAVMSGATTVANGIADGAGDIANGIANGASTLLDDLNPFS